MIYNKHFALGSLKPDGDWSWHGYDYANLKWNSKESKPTESDSFFIATL